MNTTLRRTTTLLKRRSLAQSILHNDTCTVYTLYFITRQSNYEVFETDRTVRGNERSYPGRRSGGGDAGLF